VSEIIKVGMSELEISHNPDTLAITALGSCVGVTLYDPELKVGGLAHIMLPDSAMTKRKGSPGKFADTAIEAMVKELGNRGAECSRMEAKIVGGARMFSFAGRDPIADIGERNVAAAKHALREKRIRIVAEDTNGNYGRSIEFCCSSGRVKVKSLNKGVREL
jgi:chemotaxis protein CheD